MSLRREVFSMAVALTLALIAVPASAAPVTHGVAVGDVQATSAVVWSRTDRDAEMHVKVLGHGEPPPSTRVKAESDYTGKVRLSGLKPETDYRYRVWFSEGRRGRGGAEHAVEGRFRTAPSRHEAKAVTFAWGGDLAGQNVCRDAQDGFPIFSTLNAMSLDFFIGLGDMIYADATCDLVGRYGNAQVPGNFQQASNMRDYWSHWKYNREDNSYRDLLGKMPYYAIWDDHEVVNDFGPLHDTRTTAPYTSGVHLLSLGLKAFLDYNPVWEDSGTPKRLYRNVRWGKHLELFILDTRQYRDSNFTEDSTARPKTMLGREQLAWLKDKLASSDATWKIIVSSVPMSIPTGAASGRDGWANYQQTTGFENELLDILQHAKSRGVRNLGWVTTDVHFAEVFRYTPFTDDPGFQVYEFVTGPLNAGLFPNRAYDTSLGAESLFFFGPDTTVTDWQEAKRWMNFGRMQIEADGTLNASINDVSGTPLYAVQLAPQ